MAQRYPEETKAMVCRLRRKGWSLGEISKKTSIPKNTLSGWVKSIILNAGQKKRLKEKIIASAAVGRPLAKKLIGDRIEMWKTGIRQESKPFGDMVAGNAEICKLACGILYLCEGAKYPSSRYLYLGNSDPEIISFFIGSLRKYFNIDESKLRFDVIHRWDQDYEELKRYWSEITGIPVSKCLRSSPDLRTKGKPTLKSNYKGICRVIYYDTTLQFKLQSIGEIAMKSGAEGS